jgi:hypothetical protein
MDAQLGMPGFSSDDPTKGQAAPVKHTVDHHYRDGHIVGVSVKLETNQAPELNYNFQDKTVTLADTRYKFSHFLAVANLLVGAINDSKQDLNEEED